jgi:hypothetical protein
LIAAKPDALFAVYAEVIMKVSSTVNLRSEISSVENVQQSVDAILKASFEKAKSMDKMSVLDNTLLVYMGILKVVIDSHRIVYVYDRIILLLNISFVRVKINNFDPPGL